MTLASRLAANLRRLRAERGMSAKDLAGVVGIRRSYVYMIEKQRRQPSFEVVEKAAEALCVDPAEMFREEE